MSKNKHRQSINDYYKEERTEILQELVKVEKKRTDTLEGVIRITSGRTFPGLAPKREAFMLKTNNKFDDQIDCMHKRLKELNEFISNKDVRQHGGNKRRRTKQQPSKSESNTKIKNTEDNTILKKGAEWVDKDGAIHLTDTEDEDEDEDKNENGNENENENENGNEDDDEDEGKYEDPADDSDKKLSASTDSNYSSDSTSSEEEENDMDIACNESSVCHSSSQLEEDDNGSVSGIDSEQGTTSTSPDVAFESSGSGEHSNHLRNDHGDNNLAESDISTELETTEVEFQNTQNTHEANIDANGSSDNQNDNFEQSDENSFGEDDLDLDMEHSTNGEEDIAKMKRTKLSMAIQGFKSKANTNNYAAEGSTEANYSSPDAGRIALYDPETVHQQGQSYKKRKCYKVKATKANDVDYIVGVLKFLRGENEEVLARCVLVVPFEDTILGMEDEGVNYSADFKPSSHVQVHQKIIDLPVAQLEEESDDIQDMPSLIYEPQDSTNNCWEKFGYFYEKDKGNRRKKRGEIKMLDVFVGAGGMCQGYKNAGYKTSMAVDKDKSALDTLKSNHKNIQVYEGDIKDYIKFLSMSEVSRSVLGRIDHVHVSPPCQGFSGKNRNGGANDVANNELSMCIIDLIRITKCTTAVFENVLGMWRRKHFHYIKNLFKELLKLGYQARCTPLRACDYGDPQKRPRFFIFISHRSAPPPQIPRKTHGEESDLLPYVTVKEALTDLRSSDGSILNANGKTTSLKPGEHGIIRLDANGLAPTVCAKSVPPFHYEEDRCITVREAASLQSFPLDYKFCGDLAHQYMQVGNAVPVQLATAVAQCVRQLLEYEYLDDEA